MELATVTRFFPGTYGGCFDRIKGPNGDPLSHFLHRPVTPFAMYCPSSDKLIVQAYDLPFVLVERPPHIAGTLHELIGSHYMGKMIGFQINDVSKNIPKKEDRERIFRRLKWTIFEVVPKIIPDFAKVFGKDDGEVFDFLRDNRHLVVRFRHYKV